MSSVCSKYIETERLRLGGGDFFPVKSPAKLLHALGGKIQRTCTTPPTPHWTFSPNNTPVMTTTPPPPNDRIERRAID